MSTDAPGGERKRGEKIRAPDGNPVQRQLDQLGAAVRSWAAGCGFLRISDTDSCASRTGFL
jgi:hypothetical protein